MYLDKRKWRPYNELENVQCCGGEPDQAANMATHE